jgi:1-acyl-sn-glycerol-3-phosphate acyltransferase
MWGVLNALQAAWMLVVTAAGFPVALVLALLSGPRAASRVASRYWAPMLLGAAGAKLDLEGADRIDWSRPQVLVANHESMIDVPVLVRAVPVPLRFMLKRELATMPFIGWYARLMGMVFIDRGNARDAKRKLDDAVGKLREGATLIAFPEGTRSKDGTVGPFKAGALQVALEAGVPVVPVAIEGAGAILAPSGFRVRPGTIRVRFGAPIETAGMQAQDRNVIAQRAREAITGMLQR